MQNRGSHPAENGEYGQRDCGEHGPSLAKCSLIERFNLAWRDPRINSSRRGVAFRGVLDELDAIDAEQLIRKVQMVERDQVAPMPTLVPGAMNRLIQSTHLRAYGTMEHSVDLDRPSWI